MGNSCRHPRRSVRLLEVQVIPSASREFIYRRKARLIRRLARNNLRRRAITDPDERTDADLEPSAAFCLCEP
jgi:hypothetical protein